MVYRGLRIPCRLIKHGNARGFWKKSIWYYRYKWPYDQIDKSVRVTSFVTHVTSFVTHNYSKILQTQDTHTINNRHGIQLSVKKSDSWIIFARTTCSTNDHTDSANV